jgi:MFS transporter, PAT family, beta-lactamase induction signal transducer AmpG
MLKGKAEKRNPWFWIPSLYYAEGIPYVIVMSVSVIMYKRLDISNTDIALYTSWLYLPWVIKPLWSPIVDIFKKKRNWILFMQLIVGAGLAGVALTIPVSNFFQYSLAFLWLVAFSSATHDIAADGFYMLGLSQRDQAWFVGIRSTFYRLSMITGQGLLVILAGFLETGSGLPAVNINFETRTDIAYEHFIHPDSINFDNSDPELQFITASKDLLVSTQKRNSAEADSILKFVSEWNINNGFYQLIKTDTDTDTSWFTENLVIPLESFIKNNFGEEISVEQDGDLTSNIAAAYVRLNSKPQTDEKIVLNLSFDSGDESISIIEGTRFEFNSHNWNKPGIVLFKLHPNLNKETTASFEGSTGNIPLAWSITFFILAGLFLMFFVYHKFILPYPSKDVSARKDESSSVLNEFLKTFTAFFKRKNIGIILGFILLYRFAESQLVKLATPFFTGSAGSRGYWINNK